MLTLVPESIETYATLNSFPEGEVFKKLAIETREKTSAASMQVGALEGAFLRLMVRITGARRILEIGTFTGYSALAMAEALPADGELITCDIHPGTTEIAKHHWAMSEHGRKIKCVLGPALETIASLPGSFDLVFIDADKENYANYLDAIYPKLKSGGVVLSDNTLWSGNVLDPQDKTDHAIVRYNDKLLKDTRFESVLTTIRDGVTISWKKS